MPIPVKLYLNLESCSLCTAAEHAKICNLFTEKIQHTWRIKLPTINEWWVNVSLPQNLVSVWRDTTIFY